MGRDIVAYRERQEDERRARRAAERELNLRALMIVPAVRLHEGTLSGSCSGVSVQKDEPVRSQAYRRLVAVLPCANCGKPGPNQAAHANVGKGMGTKTDDRTCFPLCMRCHRMHDQCGQIPRDLRREYEAVWGAQTRAAIKVAGTWPRNVPDWRGN